MSDKVGFVGGGEMAYAIAAGIVKGGLVKPSHILVSNPSAGKFKRFNDIGINTTHNNMEVFETCNIVFMAVKPQIFPTVVEQCKGFQRENQLIISVMAALTVDSMEKDLPWARVIRTMPNTPCLIQEGIILLCKGNRSTNDDMEKLIKLLASCGECIEIAESKINAAQSISGCGPAFIYTAIDALADGGVKMGVPRALALKLAAQTCVGAGQMYLKTGTHPGILKDAVTSPGGVTICGIHTLDQSGFRAALINTVEACTLRSYEMAEKK